MTSRTRPRKPTQQPLTAAPPQLHPTQTPTPLHKILPTQHPARRRPQVNQLSLLHQSTFQQKAGYLYVLLTLCLHFKAEGEAAAEENEEQEDADDQDEEKMKTSDEVQYPAVMTDLLPHGLHVLRKHFKHHLTCCQYSTGHSWTRSNSVWSHVIHRQLHPAQQIYLFWKFSKYAVRDLNRSLFLKNTSKSL